MICARYTKFKFPCIMTETWSIGMFVNSSVTGTDCTSSSHREKKQCRLIMQPFSHAPTHSLLLLREESESCLCVTCTQLQLHTCMEEHRAIFLSSKRKNTRGTFLICSWTEPVFLMLLHEWRSLAHFDRFVSPHHFQSKHTQLAFLLRSYFLTLLDVCFGYLVMSASRSLGKEQIIPSGISQLHLYGSFQWAVLLFWLNFCSCLGWLRNSLKPTKWVVKWTARRSPLWSRVTNLSRSPASFSTGRSTCGIRCATMLC